MNNKLRTIAVGIALALSLSACSGSSETVSVERMDNLTVAATVADRFAGVVVSDNAVQVSKEMDKSVKDLLVSEGDQVKEGQKLFSYDTDELNLTLDKQELEQDRVKTNITNLKKQVTALEKEIKELEKAKKDANAAKLNLRQAQMELTQAEYDEDALAADIKHTKQMLKNVHVYSPVEGTVRTIDETSADAYIIIQQSGAYRIKGTLNEMSMNLGIMEGVQVSIISRLDPERVWRGVVQYVDYESGSQSSNDSMYFGYSDGMSTSTSYPFYVTLESTDGLLLGQHVYIQIAGTELPEGNYLPQSYLMDIAGDDLGMTTAAVWAVGAEGTLEKRAVTLGYYDMASGSYEILEGLSGSDYVADPANPACREGAAVQLPVEEPAPSEPSESTEPVESGEMPTEPSQEQMPTQSGGEVPDGPVGGYGEEDPVIGDETKPDPEDWGNLLETSGPAEGIFGNWGGN